MNKTNENKTETLCTQDDLSITFTSNGAIKNISAGPSEFIRDRKAPCSHGFRIREHGTKEWKAFTGTVTNAKDRAFFNADSDSLRLGLEAQYMVHEDYIEIMGSIIDKSKTERSVDLSFVLPAGGTNMRWWCDITEAIDPVAPVKKKPVVKNIEGDYIIWIDVYSVVPQPFAVSVIDENGQERILRAISNATDDQCKKTQHKIIGADLIEDGKWDIYVIKGIKESDFVDGKLHIRVLNSNESYNNIDVSIGAVYLFNSCEHNYNDEQATALLESGNEKIKEQCIASWVFSLNGRKSEPRFPDKTMPFEINAVSICKGSWNEFWLKKNEYQVGWSAAMLSGDEPIRADSQGIIRGFGYPWATVTQKQGNGYTLGVWPGMSCLYDFYYHAGTGEMELIMPFGLSSIPQRAELCNRAPFHFIIYRTDDEWGFRAAAERYYTFLPELYKRRTARFGFWWSFNRFLGRTVPPGYEYHGLDQLYAFMEIHEGDLYPRKFLKSRSEWGEYREWLKAYFPRHTELGISVLPYRHFYQNSLHVKGYMDGTLPAMPKSYDEAMHMLETNPIPFGNGYGHHLKEVIHSSTFKTRNDQYDFILSKSPIAPTGRMIFRLNISPYLYEDKPDVITNARAELDFAKDVLQFVPEIAGIYYDQGAGNGGVDYAPDHMKYAHSPLVPGPGLGRTDVYEFGRWISDFLHKHEKFSFTNGGMDMSNHTVWSTMAFDAHGVEQAPMVANERIYRFLRTISGPKPLATAMCIPTVGFEIAAFDRLVQRACVYNIFPPNVDITDPVTNKKINTAELVAPYGKLFQDMYQAEWQPLTYARCNKPDIIVERYGPIDGKCYFAVYNKTGDAKEILIDIDWLSSGMKQIKKAVEFLVVKGSLSVNNKENICQVGFNLPGLQTAVVQIGEENTDDPDEIINFYPAKAEKVS